MLVVMCSVPLYQTLTSWLLALPTGQLHFRIGSITLHILCCGLHASDQIRYMQVREPRAVLKEFGTELPADVAVHVHDSTADLR